MDSEKCAAVEQKKKGGKMQLKKFVYTESDGLHWLSQYINYSYIIRKWEVSDFDPIPNSVLTYSIYNYGMYSDWYK